MIRLRQAAAALLSLAILLAVPALCLHLITAPGTSAAAGGQTCSHVGVVADGMAGMRMAPTAQRRHSEPASLPDACCAAHPQLAAVVSPAPTLPGLDVTRLPLASRFDGPITDYTGTSLATFSPPPLLLQTSLRV